MSSAERDEADRTGESSYYRKSKLDRLGADEFVLQAWTPSPAASTIMLGNDLIAQQHLERLKGSVRQAIHIMEPVRAIQRIRFNGVTVPAELRAGEFWWLEPTRTEVRNGRTYVTHIPEYMQPTRGARPPLGAATWCYQEVRRPAATVKINWNITAAEVSGLFRHWDYKSILNQGRSYTGCIDEGRGVKVKQHALSHSQLTLVMWTDLAEWMQLQTRCEPYKVAELEYDRDGYSVDSLSVDAGHLAPLTRHEARALARRPLLRKLLRDATAGICEEFADIVHAIWHGSQRRAERRQEEEEEAAKERAEQLERARELESDEEEEEKEDELMDDTLITEEGSSPDASELAIFPHRLHIANRQLRSTRG
jgi:hypothetical protein